MPTNPPVELTPRHMQALRLIVAGLPVGEASKAVGLTHWRMSQVYRSELGMEYVRYLHSLADNYAAIMIALGITPGDISRATGGGQPPRKSRPRKRGANSRIDLTPRPLRPEIDPSDGD